MSVCEAKSNVMESGEAQAYSDIHLPIGDKFRLSEAVCSHGLFMMAPNQWDPLSQSLLRPLRLSQSQSLLVRISHPSPLSLLLRVLGAPNLSDSHRASFTAQVTRMLRLSESEERKVSAFQSLHAGVGRVFRSPTLFEDMVKCILLCNCQWPRTLSMAKALCQLQLELQNHPSVPCYSDIAMNSKSTTSGTESICPVTPAGKESTKPRKPSKVQKVIFKEETSQICELESDISEENLVTTCGDRNCDRVSYGKCEPYSEGVEQFTQSLGNFPSPEEIASLDEKYLAKRCNLGYRAGRILKLAQSIVEGKIQLSELEDLCNQASSSSYYELDQKLKEINGFGPFTRSNLLMCMGFYYVIPTDSETIRHLKQVHGIRATPQTVQKVVEKIYGSFEPFQFLAYWSEVWNFYEEWFGKISNMPPSEYGLITARKMRAKRKRG